MRLLANALICETGRVMKKAVIFFIIGLVIAFVYFLLTGEDKNAKGIFTLLVISAGILTLHNMMPKQEGAMIKAINLIVVGFVIAIPGWMIAAFAHSKIGAVLFVIGWLIGTTGMVIAIWKNPYYQSKMFAKAMKIGVTGFVVFAGGILLSVVGIMEEEKNIVTYAGIFIFLAGWFVGMLAIIEDRMRGPWI